MLNLVVHKTE